MRWKSVAIAVIAVALASPGIVKAQGTRTGAAPSVAASPKVVRACTTPNGIWGYGGNLRVTLQVYADQTARYGSVMSAEPPDAPWRFSNFFPATGGEFISALGHDKYTATPEGDGYAVAGARGAHAHFRCGAVGGTRP